MLQVQIVHYLHEYIEYTHAGQPICNISSTQCCESKHNVQYLDLDPDPGPEIFYMLFSIVTLSILKKYEQFWHMKKGLNKDGELWSVPPPPFF